MKKILLLVLVSLCSISLTSALDANISFATFKSKESPYIEVYLHLIGSTTSFKRMADSTFTANVEVVILFKQGEEIVKFDKYLLNNQSDAIGQDFFDIKRYGMDAGSYQIEVSINDVNETDNSKSFQQKFDIGFEQGRVNQSDIQLLTSLRKAGEGMAHSHLTKGGYIFEPLPSQFLDRYSERLIFYNEIYDTDILVGEDFLVSYFLEELSGEKTSGAKGLVHKRKSPAEIVPMLQQVDISQLPSGNYNLVVEVKNKSGELLTKKSISFQRSNPYLDQGQKDIVLDEEELSREFVGKMSLEELRYGLKAIAMQVDKTDGEVLNLIISEGKMAAMRLYLFSFWARENPVSPETAFKNYMSVAKAIDKKFQGGFGYGFETDRGYVYMKYGVPNDVVTVEDEQDAPPYEIWFYSQFPQTSQNNVKFIFYNPDLATNGHELLHSNARGEINNPNWEVLLYRNSPNDVQGSNFIDATNMQGKMGRHARRLYESF